MKLKYSCKNKDFIENMYTYCTHKRTSTKIDFNKYVVNMTIK